VMPLFTVHKPGRIVEVSRDDTGRYRVTATVCTNGHVEPDAKRLANYQGLNAEQAIEALAAVLARKTRRSRNGSADPQHPRQ
jgi:hypothetical protein